MASQIQADNNQFIRAVNECIQRIKMLNAEVAKVKNNTIHIQTSAAAANLNRLRSDAVSVRRELRRIAMPSIDVSGVSSAVAALRRLEVQAQRSRARLSSVGQANPVGTETESDSGVMSKVFGKLSAVGSVVGTVLGQAKDVASFAVSPGYKLTKETESSKLAVAGTLTSMAAQNGQAVDFQSAKGIADSAYAGFQKEAAKSPATANQLMETFQAILAPGLDAGMNVEEVQKLAALGGGAGKAIGLPRENIERELKGMVEGNIAGNSFAAKTLGLTNEDIEAAKNSAQGLFAFLEERMAGLAEATSAFPDTLEGKMAALEEAGTFASAKLVEAVEPEMKAVAGFLTGVIAQVNAETGEFELNPKIQEVIAFVKDGLDNILGLFGEIDSASGNFKLNDTAIEIIDIMRESLSAAWSIVESLYEALNQVFNNDSFSYVQDYWLPVLLDFWRIMNDLKSMIADVITVIGNLAGTALEAVAPFSEAFAGAIGWAVEKLRDFVEMARIGWDWLVKLSGGRKNRQKGSAFAKSSGKAAVQAQREEPDKTSITSRRQAFAPQYAQNATDNTARDAERAERERQKQAQDALKEMLKYWKYHLEDIQSAYKKQQDGLKLRLDQKDIGYDQYHLESLQNELSYRQSELAAIDGRMEAIQHSGIDESSKRDQLEGLQRERDLLQANIRELTEAFQEMAMVLSRQNTITPEQAIRKYGLDPKGFETASPDFTKANTSEIDGLIAKYAAIYGMDPYLIKAMVSQESGGNAGALSEAGAAGLMQLMPGTAAAMGVTDRNDPEQNIMGGVKYIAEQLASFGGNVELALAAYNAGPQAVRNAGGIPNYAETRNYVPAVLQKRDELKQNDQVTATTPQSPKVGSGEGVTWYRVESENPKYDALEERAKQALEQIANYVYDLTGSAIGLTSGKRSADLGYTGNQIGGHGSGLKFDAVAKAFDDPSVRDKVIAYANNLGVSVLDEYTEPTQYASGLHLDFNAQNYKPSTSQAAGNNFDGVLKTRQAYEAQQDHLKMRDKARDILKKYNELVLGDVSEIQLKEIEEQYAAVRKELSHYENDAMIQDAVKKIDQLMETEKLKINFTQVEKDIETAYDNARRAQKKGFEELANGTSSALEVTQKAVENYVQSVEDGRVKLESMLIVVKKIGLADWVKIIEDKLNQINENIGKFYKTNLEKLEEDLQRKLSLIESNPNYTTLQKKEYSDEARREYLQKAIEEKEGEKEKFKKIGRQERENFEIQKLQNQLDSLGPTLDKVHQESKQAFEDGLLDFLKRGIMECESLGDAFRKLANGILQSIQNVYAEAITKDIISALFPTNSFQLNSGVQLDPNFGYNVDNPFQNILGYARGGSTTEGDHGGLVSGQGTETSDSILSLIGDKIVRISQGEYVVNAAAVKRVGKNFLDRVNSGNIHNMHISIPKFANGGAVGNIGAMTASRGLQTFTQEMGVSLSPNVNITTKINGDGFVRSLEEWINTKVDTGYEKNMREKSKLQSMLYKRY